MSGVLPKIAILSLVTPGPLFVGIAFAFAARDSFRDGDRIDGLVSAFNAVLAFVIALGVVFCFFFLS